MKNKLIALLSVLIVAIIAVGGYIGYTLKQENTALAAQVSNPQAQQEAQTQKARETVEKLKKIISIDESEKEPAVASIIDPEKVKESNQEFYKNAQKDDTLIVYPRRAILFRESTNQIINIAPIINPESVKASQEEPKKEEVKTDSSTTTPKK